MSWNIAAILTVICLSTQALNVYLFLKIRVSQLETEKSVLAEVERKCVDAAVCGVRMSEHERRLAALEARRV